ncbi:VaFE repeat-containing surface-anchored protein [Cellulosimicrobium cellulans]|uniref:VaFE repeat-containing surface-anchored protein n=1 Tax=Cellulosimicrobium cellulans TaxID=1710 RepID=UPI002096BEB5|nr:VaFE repeat-containing surface-anchored protein [Cellulosimicrobium cellulans]MCO7275515.1 VaFE repeat-containing surface-anchored protein [Cellulosimicrobium cellulans]
MVMTETGARRARREGRWLAAVVLALGAVLAPGAVTAAADVEPGDTVHVGGREGYGGTGLFPIRSDGTPTGEVDYWAYCLEHDVSARTGVVGTVGDLDEYLGENYFTDPAVQGKVLWVLAHSYPALSLEEFGVATGVPGISRNDAIEATQYAIWRYTDLTWDAAWNFETPASEAAYWYLVEGANASPGLTPAELEVTASISAPVAPQRAGSLVGPFVVSTNQPTVAVSVDPTVAVTDGSGSPVDLAGVVDGQELFLDLRDSTTAGEAVVRVTAAGSSSTGRIISVPTVTGGTPTGSDHAQTIVLVTPSTTRTSAEASASWSAVPAAADPVIGTSLVDSADGDRVLPWNGGTVIDTIAYQNLTPGVEHTVTGELVRKSDGTGTGITGSTTFTPAEANGSVEVSFVVPAGYAGEALVAFERLRVGTETTGDPVAVHEDIDDAAQTVTIEALPQTPAPVIGTSLVDSADGDRVLPWDGGTVVDTVSYQNLVPGTEYTVTGELVRKSDGTGTGITGSTTFTPAEPNGSVDVSFVVPAGHAGETLVAFEELRAGTDTAAVPVAEHTDLDDAAQTVTVDAAPVTAASPTEGDLPATGVGMTGAAVGAAALLLLGTAFVLVRRARARA